MNGKELQEHINKENKEDIKSLYRHADVANREMSIIKTDMGWVKKSLQKLENRVWWILGTVIIGIAIQIYLSL